MEGSVFDEAAFFRALAQSGARALLIGRRAMVVLGLPVLTADYDFWIHVDDIEPLNAAALPFGLRPSRSPAEARASGRYVLENDERVDVMVARSVGTIDGVQAVFTDLWARHESADVAPGVAVAIPALDDLILTKRLAPGWNTAEDVRLLQAASRQGSMSARTISPDLARELRAITERRLSPEDFEAVVRAPMSDDERAGILENVAWFTARYPTPAARLAYVRRAYARWAR